MSQATMTTNHGDITFELYDEDAPKTVDNFRTLAEKGYYDGLMFHRIIRDFMIQGGCPQGTGTGGPGYQFPNEYPTNQYQPDNPALQQPVLYPRGTIAMANAGPGTNGSQFFLVYKDSKLPPGYTGFGTVDETGLATLDKIAAGGVAGGGQDGKPATDVQITSVLLD